MAVVTPSNISLGDSELAGFSVAVFTNGVVEDVGLAVASVVGPGWIADPWAWGVPRSSPVGSGISPRQANEDKPMRRTQEKNIRSIFKAVSPNLNQTARDGIPHPCDGNKSGHFAWSLARLLQTSAPSNLAIWTNPPSSSDQANRAASTTRRSSIPTTSCWTGYAGPSPQGLVATSLSVEEK